MFRDDKFFIFGFLVVVFISCIIRVNPVDPIDSTSNVRNGNNIKAEIKKVESTIVEIDKENFIKKGLVKVYLKYPYQSDFIKDAILLKVEEFSDDGWSGKNVGDKVSGLLFIGKKIEIQTIINQKTNQDK